MIRAASAAPGAAPGRVRRRLSRSAAATAAATTAAHAAEAMARSEGNVEVSVRSGRLAVIRSVALAAVAAAESGPWRPARPLDAWSSAAGAGEPATPSRRGAADTWTPRVEAVRAACAMARGPSVALLGAGADWTGASTSGRLGRVVGTPETAVGSSAVGWAPDSTTTVAGSATAGAGGVSLSGVSAWGRSSAAGASAAVEGCSRPCSPSCAAESLLEPDDADASDPLAVSVSSAEAGTSVVGAVAEAPSAAGSEAGGSAAGGAGAG
jgi:hypothetical protein